MGPGYLNLSKISHANLVREGGEGANTVTDSSIHKKITSSPTYKTHPDIIVRGNLDNLEHGFFDLVPRDFATARNVNIIKNKYSTKDATTLKGKLAEFSTDLENRMLLAIVTFAGGFITAMLGFIGLPFAIGPLPVAEPIKITIGVIMSMAFLFSIVGIPVYKSEQHGLCNFNTPEFLLSRKDKKAFTRAEFVSVPRAVTERLDPCHLVYVHNLHAIFTNDEDILDTLDFSELRQAYDNYADLFVFLSANEEAISHTLYHDYREELRRRGTRLSDEIAAVNTLIKKHKESRTELARAQHEITQDMLDADALRAMPLVSPEKAHITANRTAVDGDSGTC